MKSSLRFVAAGLTVVAAAARIPVIEDDIEQAPYIGVLFILLTACFLTLSVLLVRADTRKLWLISSGIAAVAVGAYVWSRSIGLPQITDDIGKWTEPLGLVAITSESLIVVAGVAAVARKAERRTPVRMATRTPLIAGIVVLLLGLSWTGVAAATTTSIQNNMAGMDMSGMQGDSYWNQVGGEAFHGSGVTRVYYISADLVTWNYAPTGKNQITGKPFDEVAATYVKTGPGRIGSNYLKCLYRQYSDAGFGHVVARPAGDQYLGLLGPVIRAAVGDTIKVVFRNTCPFADSMHPHGVFYTKSSEGAPYNDGTRGSDKADDAVPTGGKHTYIWLVPERAGPGPHDGSSVMWMYHSHTDEIGDTYAGLMGPMVVTRSSMARPDGSPKDVDQERFALFSVMNENNSPLLDMNERRFEKPYQAPKPDDDDFNESNLMHSVNGYVFGNQPMITMKRGQRIRWYVMSMGTEVDLHTPHWHGNDVTVGGMRMDVVSLLPAGMVVADMKPDNVGTWLFHCHVNDHIAAGMITRYAVTA